MTINFILQFRKKKELYLNQDEITVLIRLFIDKKILNLSTGIKIKYGNWIENWKNTRDKNPIGKKERNHLEKNLILKTKEKEIREN